MANDFHGVDADEIYHLMVEISKDPRNIDLALQHPTLGPILNKLSARDIDTLAYVAANNKRTACDASVQPSIL
jgi:hypothetical protein